MIFPGYDAVLVGAQRIQMLASVMVSLRHGRVSLSRWTAADANIPRRGSPPRWARTVAAMDEPDNGAARQARDSRDAAIDPSIARDMSELSRELQADTDPQSVMRRIVRATADEVEGACGAAITLLVHGQVVSPAHSDERARRVGEAQTDTGEGPCVDTSRQEVTMRSDDLRRDDRWPKWAAAAAEQGVLSAMSFQLFVERDSMGALDVYSDRPGGFSADAENTALLLASHAAIALADTREIANLRTAVASRDVIGQAKGILMERYKITANEAFDLLAMSSQRTNLKLRDTAAQLADFGELPVT